MKIIAILSQKGGVGKTTLALHVATAAEAAGKACVVIDIDPQASAAGWKDTRNDETLVSLSPCPTLGWLQACKPPRKAEPSSALLTRLLMPKRPPWRPHARLIWC